MGEARLQKLIAQAGVASRRKAEGLIAAGRVRLNGEVVTELGTKADPAVDRIEVDGAPLELPDRPTWVILNKPAGVVTTAADEYHRKTVLDLVPAEPRLFPVGRLDKDTEGVLLLTNDGELAAFLTHPSNEIPKTYEARVQGEPGDEVLARLTEGVLLEDGVAVVIGAIRLAPDTLQLTVVEGRNRLIKRLLEALGHPVLHLRRTHFAHLTTDQPPGRHRPLTPKELESLRNLQQAP